AEGSVPAPGPADGSVPAPGPAVLVVNWFDEPGSAGAAPGVDEGALGSAAPLDGAVVAVVPPPGHEPDPELPPDPFGHCGFLPFLDFEQVDDLPVVVVVDVFLPFFLLPAFGMAAVPGDAVVAAADGPGRCTAVWTAWLAASAELNPASPAAVARAPAAASRPMRMRDIGTSLFRRGGRHLGRCPRRRRRGARHRGQVPNFSAE